jgi:shikimate 5-dehydrogenase
MALYKQHIIDPLHFYLLGESVFYSLSPAIHGEAYRVCGMGRDYKLYETSSLEDIRRLSKDVYLGRASISQPFKVGIVADMKAMSKHALLLEQSIPFFLSELFLVASRRITALNLRFIRQSKEIVPDKLLGGMDNTDWIGVTNCLQRNISPINTVQPTTTALVIGAGGMARAAIYAVTQLSCRKVYIYNRAYHRAMKVADHFNNNENGSPKAGEVSLVEVLTSTSDEWPSNRQLLTIIVSAIPAHTIRDRPAANFTLLAQWLTNPTGGIIVEVNDIPFTSLSIMLISIHS